MATQSKQIPAQDSPTAPSRFAFFVLQCLFRNGPYSLSELRPSVKLEQDELRFVIVTLRGPLAVAIKECVYWRT